MAIISMCVIVALFVGLVIRVGFVMVEEYRRTPKKQEDLLPLPVRREEKK